MDGDGDATASALEYTGERMVPDAAKPFTLWEHLYRYRFAAAYVRGLDALDVACGEAYGTAALQAAGAHAVLGLDIDGQVCARGRTKHGVHTQQGDATQLPFGPDTFDAVVSFETIEHLADPPRFIDECYRVLRPQGLLIVSTPNVTPYNERLASANPYHLSEMNVANFMELLASHFRDTRLFGQCLETAPIWSPNALASNRYSNLRGFWRLRTLLCGAYQPSQDRAARANPVAAILASESWLSRLTNPFVVRPWKLGGAETPTYIVCVARSRKPRSY